MEILARSGNWGRVAASVLSLSFTAWVMSLLLKDWFGAQHGETLRWLCLIGFIAAVLLYPLPIMRLKRKAVRLASQGNYDEALRISRIWLRMKPYGKPFRGWIMLQAGRYSEALELLKQEVFDSKNKSSLKSTYFYYYSIALMCEGKYAEAQGLLETAALVPQRIQDNFRFSLAECLLSQGIEAPRACELVEQVIADMKGKPQSQNIRTFLAQCLLVHAWGLASCGRREDAQVRIVEAFEESDSFGKDDLAGLLLLKGSAAKALGDSALARVAVKQALTIFPYGTTAAEARRKLANLS